MTVGFAGSSSTLPQPFDERVHAPNGHERFIRPGPAHKRLAAQHDPRLRQQDVEQIELLVCQLDIAPADAYTAARWIHFDVAERNRLLSAVELGRDSSASAPHHGANTCQQLADPEGFRQIVVGPAVQSEHLVRLVAARGEHEDGYVAVRGVAAYRPADGHPVNPRQHQVEHDEIERLSPREVEPLDPSSGSHAFNAFDPEMKTNEIADVLLVLDDEGGAPRFSHLVTASSSSS